MIYAYFIMELIMKKPYTLDLKGIEEIFEDSRLDYAKWSRHQNKKNIDKFEVVEVLTSQS